MTAVDRCLAKLDEISRMLDVASEGVRRNRREVEKMNRDLMLGLLALPVCVVGGVVISAMIWA